MAIKSIWRRLISNKDDGPNRWKKLLVLTFSITIIILVSFIFILVPNILSWSDSAYSQENLKGKSEKKEVENKVDREDQYFTLSKGEVPLLIPLKERIFRLEKLDERQRLLDEQEEMLRSLEEEIDKKLSELSETRKAITELLEKKNEFEKHRFEHLVKIYESMKPDEASSLIEQLNEETAIQLLANMNSKKASKILEVTKTERAAKLSEKLARLKVDKNK